MDTHLRELGKSFPMNTSLMFFKNVCALVLWTKVASALEGLDMHSNKEITFIQ